MTIKTERGRGLGRKNKRGDRKGESNDSPEIPDRRRTSDIPGLPSGALFTNILITNHSYDTDSTAVYESH